jgi:hypothetical protein
MPKLQWLTTAPHPNDPLHGEDGGKHGWKLHAVKADDAETFKGIGRRAAACGLRPAHGWGMDLFVPDEPTYRCQRCVKRLEKDN